MGVLGPAAQALIQSILPTNWRSTHLAVCLQFNREKVPERVVHARGFTVKGFFEVRQLIGQTAADLSAAVRLQERVLGQHDWMQHDAQLLQWLQQLCGLAARL